MDEFKFVEVAWQDARSESKWCDFYSLPRCAAMITRGWLVVNESGHVTLAASYATDIPEHELGEVITIPRGCITSITELPLQIKTATIIDFETGVKSE